MNHIYHSIWNEALGAWITVSEIAIGQGKRSSNRRKLNSRHSSRDAGIQSQGCETHKPFALSLSKGERLNTLTAAILLLTTTTAHALPTGNELIAGQATVTTLTAGQMQINQASQNAIINWQGFSIDPNQAVNIQQPNAQAALLNRVIGQDASQIQGQLNANGEVYLVNPNGVLFSKTAQVDVGGLIASTHNITNADFMNGNHHYTQNGATGSIENQGNIKTPEGGIVALIGKQVSNSGNIQTPKGTTALAAGKTVDLDFQGNGLIEVKVTEAALNAQITNQGAIQADGGHVILTANAAGQLIDTVINSQGVIQARGLIEKNGVVKLSGGNTGTVEIGGIIDTSTVESQSTATGGNIDITGANINLQDGAKLTASGNTNGGNITIGDKQTTHQTTIQQGATVTANTLNNGTAGTINVLANINDGKVQVDGQLNAAAPKNGDGGFIDTSAAHVNVADTAKISTKAANGKTGKWLIDPTDYTIAASGGDTTGANLATYLGTSNIEVKTLATGTTGQGDIFVNDAVTWNNTNQLTLTAHRNVNINAPINAAGGGNVNLRADSLGTDTGTVSFAGSGHVTANNGAAVNIYYNPISYTNNVSINSSKLTLNTGSYATVFMLVNNVNKLQAMNTNLSGNYALGKDIDASATSTWNSSAGFSPVGVDWWATPFTGNFDGLGHTITGLTINRPTTNYVGLFSVNKGNISNVGIVGGSVNGKDIVGGLVGYNYGGTVNNSYATSGISGTYDVGGLVGVSDGVISNVHATGNINASSNQQAAFRSLTCCVSGLGDSTGGLVGRNLGTISNAYATGSVNGIWDVGGLVGNNNTGTISNVYATGNVNGNWVVGGLVGMHNIGTISNAYATGNVSGTDYVGGLVGYNQATINNSYRNTTTLGQTVSAGGAGLTTAQMKQQASFIGWNFANTWQINEGVSYPTLRASNTQPTASIITPIVVTTNPNSTPITPVTPVTAPSTTPAQTTAPILVSGTPNSTPITTPIVVSGNPSSTPIDTTPTIDVSGNPSSTPLPDKSSNTDVNGNADSTVKTFIGPKQNIDNPNAGLLLITDNSGKGPLVPPCQLTGSCQSTQPIILNEQNSSNTSFAPLDSSLKDIKIGEVSLYEYAQSKMNVIKAREELQNNLKEADKATATMYGFYEVDPAVKTIMRNYNTQAANYSSQLGKTYVGYEQYISGFFSHLGDGVKNSVTGEIVLLKGLKAELDLAIQLRTEGLKKAKDILDSVTKLKKLETTIEVAESVELITKVTELMLPVAEKGINGSKDDYADMALKLVDLINNDKKLAEKIKLTDLGLKIKKLSSMANDYQKKTKAISAIPETAGITPEEKARFQEALDSEMKNATDDVTQSLFSFLPLPDYLKSGTEFGKAFIDSFSEIDDRNDNRELLNSVQRNNNTANTLHNWSNLVVQTKNHILAVANGTASDYSELANQQPALTGENSLAPETTGTSLPD